MTLVLAIDTATPAVTAGVVRLDGGAVEVLAERVTVDARAHAEQLTPNVVAALADAGITAVNWTPSSSGAGPARSPVCGWEWPAPPPTGMRSTFRCTAYAASTRSAATPTATRWSSPMPVGARCTGRVIATGSASTVPPSMLPPMFPARPTRWRVRSVYPTVAGLVRAVADLTAEPAPLVPLYLRRPDAKPPQAVSR